MRRGRWWVVLVVWLGAIPGWAGQSGSSSFFPLSEVRPGLKGVGRTIIQGRKPSEFQVEMLGVLENVLAPKHNAILARFSGAGLENTGVVAGMSGSPVYVGGKLVGAVAIAFPFAKEPYGLITPIADMLDVVPATDSVPKRAAAANPGIDWRLVPIPGRDEARLIPDPRAASPVWPLPGGENGASEWVAKSRLPLRFGGFDKAAVEAYAPYFRWMGFEPMVGGGWSGVLPAAAAGGEPFADTDIEPGSMISLMFVRGDLNLNADCTVTYTNGKDLYACGHQVFLTGPTAVPFAKAEVLATVPSLATSFKIDAPGPLVGTIRQDRFGAIYGVLGDRASGIPVHIHLSSTLNRNDDYNFQVAEVPFLSPLLLNLGIVSAVQATERTMGPSTLDLSGAIQLSNGDSIRVDDTVSSEAGAANGVGAVIATPLNYVLNSGFQGLEIKSINLNIRAENQNRVARVEQVWSTASEVRPGEKIEVTALLRTPWGETLTEKIPVTIPDSVTDKRLSLVVGSGTSLNMLEGRLTALTSPPRDAHQLVKALNRMRRNNRVYALLMAPQRSLVLQGDEFPSPPPSLLQMFLADPAASSRMTFSGTSVIADDETEPTPYTIQGDQTLYLNVADTGR